MHVIRCGSGVKSSCVTVVIYIQDYLTALHVAAHYGNVSVAKLLLDCQCEVDACAMVSVSVCLSVCVCLCVCVSLCV